MEAETFANKWGVGKIELEPMQDEKCSIAAIASLQLVCIVLILFLIKPAFVMYRPTRDSTECFHLPAAVTIGGLLVILTYCYPTLMRR
jgi:hypothetical protein